jgi:hypothetical protein
MIVIAPFEPGDADAIVLQPDQAGERAPGEYFAAAGPAWTVRDAQGRILACLGLAVAGPSVRIGWGLLAIGKGADLVPLTRVIRRVIAGGGWNRVEIQTRASFEGAATWARLLGFEFESVKKCAAADGGDLIVWARYRDDARTDAEGEA